MQCKFIKSDDLQCEANATSASEFCFSHNPEMHEAKIEAVTKGGKSPRKNYDPLEPVELKDSKDIVKLASQVINEVRQGAIDIRVANCIFYGTGQLIKAFEIADLEERVTKIEEIIIKHV